MKFCKDCKWVADLETSFVTCINPRVIDEKPLNMITGERHLAFADTARRFGPCGEKAKFFEPCENQDARAPREE